MYPIHVTVRLDEDQFGYSPGRYYLASQSLYVKDRFGNRVIGRLILMAEDTYHAQFLAQVAQVRWQGVQRPPGRWRTGLRTWVTCATSSCAMNRFTHRRSTYRRFGIEHNDRFSRMESTGEVV